MSKLSPYSNKDTTRKAFGVFSTARWFSMKMHTFHLIEFLTILIMTHDSGEKKSRSTEIS